MLNPSLCFFFFFLSSPDFFIAFRDRRREGKRETEISIRERSLNWLLPTYTQIKDCTRLDHRLNLQPGYLPWPGIEPEPLVMGWCSNLLSHTSQGPSLCFLMFPPGVPCHLSLLNWTRRGNSNASFTGIFSTCCHYAVPSSAPHLGFELLLVLH